MKDFIKAMDDLPFILKVILAIPGLDIIWSIYKLCRSIRNGNIVYIVLGVLTIVPGAMFMWLIDLLCIILGSKKHVWWFC